jgi:hypothetical protein
VLGRRLLGKTLDGVFGYGEDGLSRWIRRLWTVSLYITGVLLWAYILNRGRIPLELHDWAEITAPRYAFLRDAVMRGSLPLHMPGTYALRNVTDRFISVADTDLSPQVLLLRFLDIGPFFLVNTILLFTVGFLGMLALRNRYRLSPMAFSCLFFLFAFNGDITDHLVVGHVNWVGCYLLPILAALVFRLLGGDSTWRPTLLVSLLLFFMFLQGAFHLLVACILFLILLALTSPRNFTPLIRAIAFALLLSMVRILPPLLEASRFDTAFLSGFTSVRDMFAGLVELRVPVPQMVFSQTPLNPLGWWELDYYVGLVGLVFIVYFGIIPWFRKGEAHSSLAPLLTPIFILSLLSVGRIYKLIHLLGIPFLASERVSSRLLIVPLAMLVILAAINFQRALDRGTPKIGSRLAYLGLLGLMVQDLWQHIKLWRVENMGNLFPATPVDLARSVVANHPDPPYVAALAIGLTVSALTLAFLIIMVWRESAAARRRV